MKIISLVVIVSYCIPLYSIVVIGHRGASGHCIENTLSSFERAIECNADMIEFDVRKCASGELIVFHDAQVDRLTAGNGYVALKTLSELKQLKVLGVEQIPTVAEVFDYVDRRVKLYIELKSPAIACDILRMIEYYVQNKQWCYDDFLIASFDHTQLQEIKALNDRIIIVALMYGIPVSFGASATDVNADVVGLDSEFITKAFVDDIHDRGMLVYVYTINDRDDLIRLLGYGVDGIITDYPDYIRDLLLLNCELL
ncbi:MAG TPA: glycerophosphodiester phosphodiesterase [Candidatus Babeliales bacterium]|nr:glycerophosphodiester phosphodiesterase [Candidatus Babeliales bacterium]